jgi:hypothetical protein
MREAWQDALVGTTCQSSWGTSGWMWERRPEKARFVEMWSNHAHMHP